MNKVSLTLDSLALLVLCGDFPSAPSDALTQDEWYLLRRKMKSTKYKRPSCLFNMSLDGLILVYDLEAYLAKKIIDRIRWIPGFLSTLKSYEEQGIFVTTKYEEDYPEGLFASLKRRAPLILYYVGQIHLLKTKMIGLSGTKDLDVEHQKWIQKITQKIIESDLTLVTGQNRGCEQEAIEQQLKLGGDVVLVASNHLASKALQYRKALKSSSMLILSATDPFSSFNVTHAIDSNSYIYGMASEMIILSCYINNGDAWFSAMQNLHYQWAPINCVSDYLYPGNIRLIELGANPLALHDLDREEMLLDILKENRQNLNVKVVDNDQLSIYDFMNDDAQEV